MVTNRKETRIKIQPKAKSSLYSISNSGAKLDEANPGSRLQSSESIRPYTQASSRTKAISINTFSKDQDLNLQTDTPKTAKSSENISKLKSIIWDKKTVVLKDYTHNRSIESINVESPGLNPSILPKIYSLRPFLMPFIEEFKNRREEIETLGRHGTGEYKVSWSIRETFGDRPCTREGSQLVVVRNKVYIFGGQSRIKHTDIRQLDILTWTWKILNTLYTPQGRLGHCLVPYKGKIVLYGGQSQHSQNLGIRRCSRKVYFLSVNKKKWQFYVGDGESPDPRRHHAAAQLGKFMLVYGGMNQQGHILSNLYILDMKAKKWIFPEVSIEKDPGPRSHSTLTPVFDHSQKENYIDNIFKLTKNKAPIEFLNCGFYLFGGMISDAVLSNELHGLYIRDGKLVWTRISNFIGTPPSPRCNHTACAVRARIFIFGGRNDGLFNIKGDSSLDDLFSFNVANLKWETLKISGSTPLGRWGHCMTSIGARVLMLGGLTNKSFMSADLNVLESEKDVSIDVHNGEPRSPDIEFYSYKQRKKTLKSSPNFKDLFKIGGQSK